MYRYHNHENRNRPSDSSTMVCLYSEDVLSEGGLEHPTVPPPVTCSHPFAIDDSWRYSPGESRPTIGGSVLEPISCELLPTRLDRVNSAVFFFLVPDLYAEPSACFDEPSLSTSKTGFLVAKKEGCALSYDETRRRCNTHNLPSPAPLLYTHRCDLHGAS